MTKTTNSYWKEWHHFLWKTHIIHQQVFPKQVPKQAIFVLLVANLESTPKCSHIGLQEKQERLRSVILKIHFWKWYLSSRGKSLLESWCTTFLPDWQPPLIFVWFISNFLCMCSNSMASRGFHVAKKSTVPLTTDTFGSFDRDSAVFKSNWQLKHLRKSVKVSMIFQIKIPRHGYPELFTTSVSMFLNRINQSIFSAVGTSFGGKIHCSAT